MNLIKSETRITLATKITILRLLMTPVFVLIAIYYINSVRDGHADEKLRWIAAMVFLITCATDALDGYIARVCNDRTKLGTLLDPIADKVLLLSGLIVLTGSWGNCFNPHIPVWYVLLVISRDLILTVGTVIIHMVHGQAEVKPRIVGKIATFFQMGLILWVLFSWPPGSFEWILWMATAFTLVSMVLYLIDGVHQLEKGHTHVVSPPAT